MDVKKQRLPLMEGLQAAYRVTPGLLKFVTDPRAGCFCNCCLQAVDLLSQGVGLAIHDESLQLCVQSCTVAALLRITSKLALCCNIMFTKHGCGLLKCLHCRWRDDNNLLKQ